MFSYSKLSSATKLAMVALSFAGIVIALGLPLFVAAQRTFPEVVPVVGMTHLDAKESGIPQSDSPDQPPAPPEEPEPLEENTSQADQSPNMTQDEIKAAVRALLDGEPPVSDPATPAEQSAAPEQTENQQDAAEQAAAEQAAAEQAAAEQAAAQQAAAEQAAAEQAAAQQAAAEQAAAQQAAQQAAAEQAAAEQVSTSTPFHFNAAEYSANKGGYFDKLDASRTLIADEFPVGNYTSSEQFSYTWLDGNSYPATRYIAESGMIVIEIRFF